MSALMLQNWLKLKEHSGRKFFCLIFSQKEKKLSQILRLTSPNFEISATFRF